MLKYVVEYCNVEVAISLWLPYNKNISKLHNDYIKDETRNKLTVKLNIYELEVARER